MSQVRGALLTRGHEPLTTRFGAFVLHRYLHLGSGETLLALTCGDLSGDEPILARVHSSCVTSEVLGACDCDCAAQLETALAQLAAGERGVLFYLGQEGRGAGLVAKARDRMLVQASRERITTFEAYERLGLPHDARSYREVADMRELLGCRAPLLLLTNNPDKLSGLERAKVPIAGATPLVTARSPFNEHYLAAKGRAGHALEPGGRPLPSATLPRAVVAEPPRPHHEDPDWILVAAYLIPIGTGDGRAPAWMKANVWFDVRRGRPRILLVGLDGPGECGGWRAQPWSERFAPAARGAEQTRYAARVADIGAHGVGCIGLLEPGEEQPDPASERLRLDPVPSA